MAPRLSSILLAPIVAFSIASAKSGGHELRRLRALDAFKGIHGTSDWRVSYEQ
jgi:hypothetical protein